MRRRSILGTGLALAALAAGGRAAACEYFTSTLRIFHPWTRATGAATYATVCMKFDEVTADDRLIAVETPLAARVRWIDPRAAVFESDRIDLPIPRGSEIDLREDGPWLRLVGLAQPLLIARTYPLTLVFQRAGVVPVTLTVDFFGLAVPPPAAG
jgi:hypothetical protein